jgi:hypothetical protein
MKIHRIIPLGAAGLLISCADIKTVSDVVPASAGTETGNIVVDDETSVGTSSTIVRQQNGSWQTGPEGIRVEVNGPETGRRVQNFR